MSQSTHTLKLLPAEVQLDVIHGTPLQDALFPQGVEFPCGGQGRCRGCRIRVIRGTLPLTDGEQELLTPAETADGWRLACRHSIEGDLELDLAQWEMQVLGDDSAFTFTPSEGLGVAVDLGTTTLVAQLLDMSTGQVLAVRTALNDQSRHGADVMSRIEFALRPGQAELERLIRHQIGGIIEQLLGQIRATTQLSSVLLVGNTVMHHLFCGVDVSPLAHHPFEPAQPGRFRFKPEDLGWDVPHAVTVEFLPCIGGFVGSDVLAGIMATELDQRRDTAALIDLGTNGEIVIGNRDHMFCASTAAGPAFEGARISMGMQASRGAISEVRVEGRSLLCRTIGGDSPRGICGSGLVDAVAAGLDLGWIGPDGRMRIGNKMPLDGTVSLTQRDVRELQLAKAAIAAGVRILSGRVGFSLDEIQQIHLAGAFGNYINRTSARRIGLLHFPPERIVPAGNTALLGAKRALFKDTSMWDTLLGRIEHVSLNEDPLFQEIYAEEMRFPG